MMRRNKSRAWTLGALALAAAVAACNGEPGADGANPAPTEAPTPGPVATADSGGTSASADSRSNGARSIAEETDDFLFRYSYPAAAGGIADLAALLDSRLARARDELASESAQARRQAREDGFPYNKHSYSAEWKVVADLPGWLSLSNNIATYSGGAHGNYDVESLVWDKERGEAMEGIALFASPAAFEDALGERFCDALDRERERRREDTFGEDAPPSSFTDCPGIDELEVLLGSSNSRTFDRMTIYAGPYIAGPYVEGAYEIDLEIDRAVRDAVKPEFRAAFAARN